MLARPLSCGGSFVWVPTCSQLAWALRGRLKLCELWALGLLRPFQQPSVHFYDWSGSDHPETKFWQLQANIWEDNTLENRAGFYSLLLFVSSKYRFPHPSQAFSVFLLWLICSFLLSFKNIYYTSISVSVFCVWISYLFWNSKPWISFPWSWLDFLVVFSKEILCPYNIW